MKKTEVTHYVPFCEDNDIQKVKETSAISDDFLRKNHFNIFCSCRKSQ